MKDLDEMIRDNGADFEEGTPIEPLNDYQERRHYVCSHSAFPAIWQTRGIGCLPYGTTGDVRFCVERGIYFFRGEGKPPVRVSDLQSLFLPEWGRSLADMLKPDEKSIIEMANEFAMKLTLRDAERAEKRLSGYAVAAAMLSPDNHPPSC